MLNSGKRPRQDYLSLDVFPKNSSIFCSQPMVSEVSCICEGSSPWFLPLCLPKVTPVGRVELLLGKRYLVRVVASCSRGKASEKHVFALGRPAARFAVVDPCRALSSHLSCPERAVWGSVLSLGCTWLSVLEAESCLQG